MYENWATHCIRFQTKMALTCVAGVNWEGVGERDSLETVEWDKGTLSLLISSVLSRFPSPSPFKWLKNHTLKGETLIGLI